jgi:predicted DsbA family dithiol-disulfide isomerase
MAETLGLDTGTFNQCLDSGEKKAGVEASVAAAQAQGIDSTPTIFINGTEVAEWHDYNAVKQAIDAELAKAELPAATGAACALSPVVRDETRGGANVTEN